MFIFLLLFIFYLIKLSNLSWYFEISKKLSVKKLSFMKLTSVLDGGGGAKSICVFERMRLLLRCFLTGLTAVD